MGKIMTKQLTLYLGLILLSALDVTPQSRRRIPAKVQQDLVQQMIRDSQIKSSCVQEEGGASKVVDITQLIKS
jgi:hypothetical protein